ncbi:hypothetical protein QQP08_026105 [Theobroma cacao]|uniref:Uncharacterized protein n=1 Tax=Theobroma cacao TaxID=3641 RepID=A0A061GZJ0_THECC|nr:Uncharacterized protein TCM_041106 [Theobroma cacao]WRX33427.1 hypothetical protein QQP08_025914 [Theobroma cacao]WRX33618.1 hypothetical protein QQP08_026105 [Theobroma cacao]
MISSQTRECVGPQTILNLDWPMAKHSMKAGRAGAVPGMHFAAVSWDWGGGWTTDHLINVVAFVEVDSILLPKF